MRLHGDMEERALHRLAFSDDCWEWMGRRDAKGYGCLRLRGRYVRAHRAMMEWVLGRALLREEVVDHLCRNPSCARPSHLEIATNATNTQRGRTARVDRTAVEEIRSARTGGQTLRAISAAYGIHHSHVSRICTGKRWQ